MPQPAYAYAGSFYARALRRDGVINALLPNKEERPAAWSGEFNPMLEADNRVNTVTKWQPPVCPEFAAPGLNEALLDRIREDAVAQIGLSGASLTVVFDPHAYHALHESGCRGRVAYFAGIDVARHGEDGRITVKYQTRDTGLGTETLARAPKHDSKVFNG